MEDRCLLQQALCTATAMVFGSDLDHHLGKCIPIFLLKVSMSVLLQASVDKNLAFLLLPANLLTSSSSS